MNFLSFLMANTLILSIFDIRSLINQDQDFGNEINKITTNEITKFHVLGERCSGTNYLVNLILKNTPLVYTPFYQKHFIPWTIYGKTDQQVINNFSDSNCLYFVIRRNPFDWLRSLYLSPSMISENMRNTKFSDFITHEYEPMKTNESIPEKTFFKIYHHVGRAANMPDNLEENAAKRGMYEQFYKNNLADYVTAISYYTDRHDPKTQLPFENVIQLRNRKIENYINLRKIVPNIIYLDYDKLAQNPEKFIRFIRQIIDDPQSTFSNEDNYKGLKDSHYIPKIYFDLTHEQKSFIESQVNWDLEKLFKL